MHKLVLIAALLLGSLSAGFAQSNVTVEIDFGKGKVESRQVRWIEGMTALMALQQCAAIATHPTGKEYIFVSSIENVKAKPRTTAWYYKVNGESPKVLAYKNYIRAADTITWILKKDECSAKKYSE